MIKPRRVLDTPGWRRIWQSLVMITDAIDVALRKMQHVPLRVHLVLFRQMPSESIEKLVRTWKHKPGR